MAEVGKQNKKRSKTTFTKILTLFLLMNSSIAFVFAVEIHTASSLYNAMEKVVYQVRIIDIASDDKATIGSGFNAGASGLVATNYHVISLALLEPDKYRIVLMTNDDVEVNAEIVNINVLHDLALLRPEQPLSSVVPIANEELSKGDRVFSIGNPLDLGMSVVEGNFNGLVKTSRFRRFLFSGSLNPGMSGGPAFNENGELIGINVATGGEQISFLVPAIHLLNLLLDPIEESSEKLISRVESDLFDEQNNFYGELLRSDWQIQEFGEINLPHDLNSSMKCWGHNIDEEDIEYEAFHQHCQSEENIFIESSFYTGNFAYDYEWISSETLNSFQFYSAVQSRFSHRNLYNTYDEKHVSDYSCETNFVNIKGSNWKASTCLRQYKEFQKIYDATLLLVSLNDNKAAAILKMSSTGVSKDNATAMFGKLIRSISWKN